jgi:tol-pal system protein YbgF
MRPLILLTVAAATWSQVGCVTVAEFRKLEREVLTLKQRDTQLGAGREHLADFGVQLDAIQAQLAELEGRLEVVEHQSSLAVQEARSARREAGEALVRETGEESEASQQAPTEKGEPAAEGSSSEAGNSAQEVSEYRAAYATWREGDSQQCIDRFRSFLQTYPSSSYADDAAFWMADCYFKQGDFKTAILRFDDVVTRYPAGNKASEALYRQGEALLRLGPGYGKAAGKAFERVVHEYPESPRAAEAKRQLELLGPG